MWPLEVCSSFKFILRIGPLSITYTVLTYYYSHQYIHEPHTHSAIFRVRVYRNGTASEPWLATHIVACIGSFRFFFSFNNFESISWMNFIYEWRISVRQERLRIRRRLMISWMTLDENKICRHNWFTCIIKYMYTCIRKSLQRAKKRKFCAR